MEIIKKDDIVTFAKYDIRNILMGKYIYKWANCYVKNIKKLKLIVRSLLASNIASHGVKYQFGVKVPINIYEAYKLDKENGNTIWSNAIDKKVCLLQDNVGCFHVAE